jgi:hypothetical protein
MFIVCCHLLLAFCSLPVKHCIVCWALQLFANSICFHIPTSFGSAHVAQVSFPNNNMKKGRWTQDEHKIFMQQWEKFGNNLMQIPKVFSTQTPAQIKKHVECFFKQNWNTHSAAVKQYQEPLFPNGKVQDLVNDSAAHKNIGNLSLSRSKPKF